ncbi:hypothetical protein MN608_08649 [Microdochium nivale]|nr:hypothetical protein MN608_08649 [Microdochium nivale]
MGVPHHISGLYSGPGRVDPGSTLHPRKLPALDIALRHVTSADPPRIVTAGVALDVEAGVDAYGLPQGCRVWGQACRRAAKHSCDWTMDRSTTETGPPPFVMDKPVGSWLRRPQGV